MIYLFHGENQVASRKALTDLRGGYDPLAVKTLSEVSLVDLVGACESRSLFSLRLLVIWEVNNAHQLALDKRLLDYLKTDSVAADVGFWVGGTVRKTHPLLKLIKGAGKICYFPLSKEKPFSFLDTLGERDIKKAYIGLQKLFLQGESEIGLLQLIAWELKNLIRAKACGKSGSMSPYVFRKAKKQSANFSEEVLIGLLGKVLEADVAIKTGSNPQLVLSSLVYEIAGNHGLSTKS